MEIELLSKKSKEGSNVRVCVEETPARGDRGD